jgi:predicted RNA binding protein YcfA (HicA-like mRNA interferase family)
MPKPLNQRTAALWLEEQGWRKTLGGKHVVKMVKAGCRPITLPHHSGQDYGPGLSAAIRRQARLNCEEQ